MTRDPMHPMECSARILDSYVAGLRAEVARLSLMREASRDTLWIAQLDLQISLKMQVIEDVSCCLGNGDEEAEDEDEVEIDFDSLPGTYSVLPSHT